MSKKKYRLIFLLGVIFLVASFFVFKKAYAPSKTDRIITINNNLDNVRANSATDSPNDAALVNTDTVENKTTQLRQTVNPINNAQVRISKKPFGILINPKTSPVQPERFSGYHTGVDLETNSDEQNVDVSIVALCDGKLLASRFASGYGGVMVQSCNLDGQEVTIVYGHINLASVTNKIGDVIKAGDFLANLGKGFSSQTDGERKHLHLAIHKGKSINILGYVKNKNQLNDWIDPLIYL